MSYNELFEAKELLIKALPDSIRVMHEIVNDPSTPIKTRISANNALSRAESTLKRMMK